MFKKCIQPLQACTSLTTVYLKIPNAIVATVQSYSIHSYKYHIKLAYKHVSIKSSCFNDSSG